MSTEIDLRTLKSIVDTIPDLAIDKQENGILVVPPKPGLAGWETIGNFSNH